QGLVARKSSNTSPTPSPSDCSEKPGFLLLGPHGLRRLQTKSRSTHWDVCRPAASLLSSKLRVPYLLQQQAEGRWTRGAESGAKRSAGGPSRTAAGYASRVSGWVSISFGLHIGGRALSGGFWWPTTRTTLGPVSVTLSRFWSVSV